MSDGIRLREARESRGLLQKDVALAAGLSPQYLNDIEFGRRVAPAATYERLCVVLGIPNHRPDAEVARLRAEIDALNARFAQQPSAPTNGPSEEQMRAALQAFLSDRWTLRIPPQPDDPDMILDAAITELLALRRTLAAIGALAGGGAL